METIMSCKSKNETPFVVDVYLEEILSNPDHMKNKPYSVLVDPKIHKTISDVTKKLKLLFDLKKNFYIASTNSSVLPEKETAEILYYLKSIRIERYEMNSNKNKETPVKESPLVDNVRERLSPVTYIVDANVSEKIIAKIEDDKEVTKKMANGEINYSRRYTKAFSVGDFLTDLRNNTEEYEKNTSVNGYLETSLLSTDQEDCPRKRKRTRRRKKKDIADEEFQPEVPSPKYVKPYSFDNVAREESKHLRFSDNESPKKNDATFNDEEDMSDALLAAVDASAQSEINTLNSLLALKSQVGGPPIFVRLPSCTEEV